MARNCRLRTRGKDMAVADRTQYPEPGVMCFGRIPAVAALPDALWTATQTESGRKSDILLYRCTEHSVETRALLCPGNPYQP